MTNLFNLFNKAPKEDKKYINIFIKDLNMRLSKIYRNYAFYEKKPREDQRPKYDFELIRSIPIGNLMKEPVSETYGRAKYLCPLHDEKDGSFIWYKDTNSFYCFGCQKGGSVIDLVMAVHKCEVNEAMERLTSYI